MNNVRREKLMETMKSFNKSQKSEIFTLGDSIVDCPLIPTGIKEIDKYIGGGVKQGAHTIWYGQYSVGKTALVLTTIANAQKQGKLCCFVNTEKPIDRERFEFFGVNLSELVYIEAPESAEQALEAMRSLCKDKVIDLFIIDSTNGLSPKSSQEDAKGNERSLEKKDVAALALVLSNFYNKVNSFVFKAKAAVIWIGQTRTQGIGTFFTKQGLSGGNAQNFYAYQIMYLRRAQKSNNPTRKVRSYFLDPDGKLRYQTIDEEYGYSVVLKLEKTNSSKSGIEKSEIEVPYYRETGFNSCPEKELEIRIDAENEEQKEVIKKMLIEKGVIELKVDDSIVEEVKAEETEEVCELIEPKEEVKIEIKKRGRKKKIKD